MLRCWEVFGGEEEINRWASVWTLCVGLNLKPAMLSLKIVFSLLAFTIFPVMSRTQSSSQKIFWIYEAYTISDCTRLDSSQRNISPAHGICERRTLSIRYFARLEHRNVSLSWVQSKRPFKLWSIIVKRRPFLDYMQPMLIRAGLSCQSTGINSCIMSKQVLILNREWLGLSLVEQKLMASL